MLNLAKILVPVDFSERSTAAAEHAVVMANKFDSELIFLHAVPPGPYEHGFFEGGYNPSAIWPPQEEIEAKLGDQLAELASRTGRGRRIETVVSWGDPAAKIEEMAEHEQVDLIMMPSHGYGPFRRFALGSVTAKVLHDLKCPVFTGAHVEELPESATEPYECIACAIDLGPHSEAVLRWAWGFAQVWQADLRVIHASPPVENLPSDGPQFPANLRETVNKMKAEQIEELLRSIGATARVDADCADTTDFVTSAADEMVADLLVIGRSMDDSLIGRLRTHSLSLIRESPCPVISI